MPLVKGQKKRNKEARRQLTLEVGAARLRGLSIPEIARLKNLPQSTVVFYLKESQRLNEHEFSQMTQELITRQFYMDAKERMKKFWEIFYASTKDPRVQIQCLEGMGREDERMITLGQSLGLIHKEAEEAHLLVLDIGAKQIPVGQPGIVLDGGNGRP